MLQQTDLIIKRQMGGADIFLHSGLAKNTGVMCYNTGTISVPSIVQTFLDEERLDMQLYKVKDLEKYYSRLKSGVEMSTMWMTLQNKSEYGSSMSEKGYQRVAVHMAWSVARVIGVNCDLAEALTMCKGACFPEYGKAGEDVILEYMDAHNMSMSKSDLRRNAVEYDLYDSGTVITPEFDALLKELFDETTVPTTPEVRVALFCTGIIEDVKKVVQANEMSLTEALDFLREVSEDVVKSSEDAGKPVYNKKYKELVSSVSPFQRKSMTEEEKRRVYEDMDVFIEFSSDSSEPMTGIYEFML